MTTAIKIQCPHCQACFNTSQAQLNKPDIKGRCGHCQHVFLLNDQIPISTRHLSDSTKPMPAENKAPDTALSKNPTKTDTESETNILIHDDMEVDDNIEAVNEYSSLDEMDAWLSKSDERSLNSVATVKPVSLATNSLENPSLSSSTEPDINANSLTKPITSNDQLTSTSPLSSTDANNIHASVVASNGNPASENAWLETLLQEQNESTESVTDDENNNDLAQLLNKIGVKSVEVEKINPARIGRTQVQSKSATMNYQGSIATALWLAGCVMLFLLLLAQYFVFNLNTLMKNPAMAARLHSICSSAACSLPYADIDALTVTNISYESSKVTNARTTSDIKAVLLNTSENPQLLPSLKVSIYGNDSVIGEFIAQPEDYLLSVETQLAAERSKSIMFTVPVTTKQINEVVVYPIY